MRLLPLLLALVAMSGCAVVNNGSVSGSRQPRRCQPAPCYLPAAETPQPPLTPVPGAR